MTAPDPRLGEIEALTKGLTDLCSEHLRQSIRHVQRNCDIDCNVHDADPYEHDCKQPDRYDGERMAKALAELRNRDEALERVEAEVSATEELAEIVIGEDLQAGLRMVARGIRAAVTGGAE